MQRLYLFTLSTSYNWCRCVDSNRQRVLVSNLRKLSPGFISWWFLAHRSCQILANISGNTNTKSLNAVMMNRTNPTLCLFISFLANISSTNIAFHTATTSINTFRIDVAIGTLVNSAVWSSVLRRTDTVVPMRLLYARASMLTLLVQTVSSSNNSWRHFGW